MAWQGRVLAELEAQVQKRCDRDAGGCGAEGPMQHLLEGAPPAAFTLQLAWESQRQSGEDIAATMAFICEVVLCACPLSFAGFKGPCCSCMLPAHACVSGRPAACWSCLTEHDMSVR
jgi:hypothetical protein